MPPLSPASAPARQAFLNRNCGCSNVGGSLQCSELEIPPVPLGWRARGDRLLFLFCYGADFVFRIVGYTNDPPIPTGPPASWIWICTQSLHRASAWLSAPRMGAGHVLCCPAIYAMPVSCIPTSPLCVLRNAAQRRHRGLGGGARFDMVTPRFVGPPRRCGAASLDMPREEKWARHAPAVESRDKLCAPSGPGGFNANGTGMWKKLASKPGPPLGLVNSTDHRPSDLVTPEP